LRPVARAGVAYCASKHAVHALTGSTNLEERRNGIRACVIAPGETDTPAMDQRPDAPSPERRALFLRPEDVADAVVYVATQPDSVAVELLVINPAVQGSVEADFDKFLALGHTATRSD
jgi:NADP-dependent 3-hydroxy acid dehydrogenase YdfG